MIARLLRACPARAAVLGLACIALAPAAFAGEAERASAEQALRTLYDAGHYEEAMEAATLLLDYTSDEFGDTSALLIDPTLRLADIHRQLQQYPQAVETYERAATLIEINEGVFSERLVGLLRNLGDTYRSWAHAEDAAAALQRAKVITHRNYGIMNLQQVPLLEDLAEIYVDQRDMASASREHFFALRVAERRFGPDSPDLVPSLERLALWYMRTQRWKFARDLYRRAIRILEAAYGENDLRLVPPLTNIAYTYRGERSLRKDGQQALERAVRLYESTPDADVADHARSLIALGDWHLLERDLEDAMPLYAQAWNLMAEAGGGPDAAGKLLGLPRQLRYEEPAPDRPEATATADGDGEMYVVEVQFIVGLDGAVASPEVVYYSNASPSMRRVIRDHVAQSQWRPAFVDGKPVARRVKLRHRYLSEMASHTAMQVIDPGSDPAAPSATGGEVGDGPAGSDAPVSGVPVPVEPPAAESPEPAQQESVSPPPAEPGSGTP
jgi:tetratricopeptide (TPR) repeat protein